MGPGLRELEPLGGPIGPSVFESAEPVAKWPFISLSESLVLGRPLSCETRCASNRAFASMGANPDKGGGTPRAESPEEEPGGGRVVEEATKLAEDVPPIG